VESEERRGSSQRPVQCPQSNWGYGVRIGTLVVGMGSIGLKGVKEFGVLGASGPDFTGVIVP
jgi:hypothetical protein